MSLSCKRGSDKTYSLHQDTGDLVRISVGSWSSILKISIALVRALSWDADRGTTVGNTIRELINATSLMSAGETEGVVLTIDGNVLLVTTFKLLDGSLNVLHTALLSHLLRREVAVKTGTIPVARDWLGVEGDLCAELLGNAVKEETCEPELVTHCGCH